ncbi:hypothetical protein AMATHDRAFT_155306 [Amanita thiersii Skay4041]|uniref:Aminoglycoside phosphotransferase domain-containing protein n=1 Tax=Amanita thiersii Skay4041 TaxID=703135 RepID=A0A2A9NAN1_9AGAR|nr:hypothetical protein AMATHDRAFT_155306 [Amanita thiersii Skay4041]
MSGLSGEPLSNIFTDLSPDALADIQAALASMLAELREIPHPLSDMEPHISVIASKAASIHETKPYRVVFTHADLNLRNILVKNGKISGIVDWTCAGWFPEYWELTKAIHVHPRLKKWAKFWMGVLPGYEEELEVERLLWGVV